MARLVLVGLPGSGKSTLASALGAQWGCGSFDTDDVLAERVGRAASSYLREEGEAAFREQELEALRAALASDAVVATGAGIVTSEQARELLAREAVVWLDCDDETLVERVEEGERPLLGEDHARGLARLREERSSLYEQLALAKVDASGTLSEVTERVKTALRALAQ